VFGGLGLGERRELAWKKRARGIGERAVISNEIVKRLGLQWLGSRRW
jgi:hypothetical protein